MYVLIMEEDLLLFNLLGEDARDCSWTLLLILYDTVKHLPSTSIWRWASQVMLVVKNPPAMQKTQQMQVQSLGQEDPLKKGMATLSSILAWRIP